MKKFTHKTAEKQGRMALRMRFMALLGLMFLFVAGMSLDAVAQKGNNMPTPVQKSCSLQRGNAQVNLTVKGQMPGTVKVQATPVQRSAVQGKQVKGAYDITLKDGKSEWQPKAGQPVMVTIADASFTDGEYMDVYHEGDNGNEFVATVAAQNGQITFPARSFSVYIVTETGQDARLKLNFYQNSDQVTNNTPVVIYVKKADITGGHFNSIVYDPGAGAFGFDFWLFRPDGGGIQPTQRQLGGTSAHAAIPRLCRAAKVREAADGESMGKSPSDLRAFFGIHGPGIFPMQFLTHPSRQVPNGQGPHFHLDCLGYGDADRLRGRMVPAFSEWTRHTALRCVDGQRRRALRRVAADASGAAAARSASSSKKRKLSYG